MLLVRETFIAKPGHAGEFAQMMKKEMANWPGFKGHVLLDMVADYNTIIVQYEVENLAAFEKNMQGERDKNKVKEEKAGPKYTDLYQTGRREIFKIVE
jgi:heme-degrading monooxygenase HmoA